MMEIFLGMTLGIFLLFGIAYLICKLNDWLMSSSPKEMEEYSKRFIERIKTPQPEALVRHFGYPLPAALMALYQNEKEILRRDFEVGESDDAFEDGGDSRYIGFYEPLDMESLKYKFHDSTKYFAFANDGCGNVYMVDPRLEDPSVLFHDHETGEISVVCAKLSEFLAWPRKLEEKQSEGSIKPSPENKD